MRRRVALHPADRGSNLRFPSANADEDAIRIVQYFARKTKFPRVAPDRRPKSDALYPSPNADLDCNHLLRCAAARVQIHRTTSHRGTPLLPKPVMTKVSPQQAGRCHDYPKPFVWTASSTAILEKVAAGAKCQSRYASFRVPSVWLSPRDARVRQHASTIALRAPCSLPCR